MYRQRIIPKLSRVVVLVGATTITITAAAVAVVVATQPVQSLDDGDDDDDDDHVLDARRDSTTFYLISAPRVLCISINFQILVRIVRWMNCEGEEEKETNIERQMDLSCIMQSLFTMHFQHAPSCSLRFQFYCLWLIDTHIQNTQKQTTGFPFANRCSFTATVAVTKLLSSSSLSSLSSPSTAANLQETQLCSDLNFDGNRQQSQMPAFERRRKPTQTKVSLLLLIQSIENPNGHSLFAFIRLRFSLYISISIFLTSSTCFLPNIASNIYFLLFFGAFQPLLVCLCFCYFHVDMKTTQTNSSQIIV